MDERETLIKQYLPVVYALASKYGAQYDEDLLQQGALGVIQAIDTHDPQRSALITHVYNCVRWAINKYICKTHYAGLGEFSRTVARYMDRHPDVSDAEVAAHYGLSLKQLAKIKELKQITVESIYKDGNEGIHEIGIPDTSMQTSEAAQRNIQAEIVRKAVAQLPAKQCYIVCSIYGLCGLPKLSGVDLAKQFGVSRQSISYNVNAALDKLRRLLQKEV